MMMARFEDGTNHSLRPAEQGHIAATLHCAGTGGLAVELDSVILRIAGITNRSPVTSKLHERQEILDLSENSHEAVLSPMDPGGLSHALRAALASRMSTMNGDATLTAHYRALLQDDTQGTPELSRIADPAHAPSTKAGEWLAAVVRQVDLLTASPQSVTKSEIQALQAQGVGDADIVRITQLAGFVNYQVRFVAGLRLLSDTEQG